MNKKTIITGKTGRYFTLGEKSEKITAVLFACHGYAQLADEFLEYFKPLMRDNLLIVAPEGLHRFYTKGHEKVAASWMTKEDRFDDIRDYVHFLDRVHDEVVHDLENVERFIVLGFSQGAATVCRWATDGKSGIDELILFCGFFPPDLQPEKLDDRIKLCVVTASNDRFIAEEEKKKQLEAMRRLRPDLRHIDFDGEHVMKVEVIQKYL